MPVKADQFSVNGCQGGTVSTDGVNDTGESWTVCCAMTGASPPALRVNCVSWNNVAATGACAVTWGGAVHGAVTCWSQSS